MKYFDAYIVIKYDAGETKVIRRFEYLDNGRVTKAYNRQTRVDDQRSIVELIRQFIAHIDCMVER